MIRVLLEVGVKFFRRYRDVILFTTVRLNVVQYELVTTALFAIMVVSPEECAKSGFLELS